MKTNTDLSHWLKTNTIKKLKTRKYTPTLTAQPISTSRFINRHPEEDKLIGLIDSKRRSK